VTTFLKYLHTTEILNTDRNAEKPRIYNIVLREHTHRKKYDMINAKEMKREKNLKGSRLGGHSATGQDIAHIKLVDLSFTSSLFRL
jgi:hypothetical protein